MAFKGNKDGQRIVKPDGKRDIDAFGLQNKLIPQEIVRRANPNIIPGAAVVEAVKKAHATVGNLRTLPVSSAALGRIMPTVYVKKIEIEDNPDSSAFMDDARNPHIAHQIEEKKSDGSVVIRRVPVSLGSIYTAAPAEDKFSVRVEISVKQILDDDEVAFEILREFGILKFLKIKIVALVDVTSKERYKNLRTIHQLTSDPANGVFVIGGKQGISIPYQKLNPHQNEMEMTSDGAILKTTMIKKSFEFSTQPRDLVIFAVPYYDIFDNPEATAELEGDFGILSRDDTFMRTFIGNMVSEKVFENGEIKNKADIFVTNDSQVTSSQPYTGLVVEVKPGFFAKPKLTTSGNTKHSHYFYVDRKGNGWTDMHVGSNGEEHCHMIQNFTITTSGKFSPLEDTFTRFSGGHSHRIPIASSNALYRQSIPINYIIDNRSKGSLGNMRIELNKTLEDSFAFLRQARRRQNAIRPINGTSELAPYTARDSRTSYFSKAQYTSDIDTNCRIMFAFDQAKFVEENTTFGKFISDRRALLEYAPIQSVKLFRKKISSTEKAGLVTFQKYDFEYGLGDIEYAICSANPSSSRSSRIEGVSETALIQEFTPAGSQRGNTRHARYFMCMDKSYTTINTTRTPAPSNVLPILSSGSYVYGVEVTIIDNTIKHLTSTQASLYGEIKRLENYIAIGNKRGNHTGVTRQFTKAFVNSKMDNMAKDIVNKTMLLIRRVFLSRTGTRTGSFASPAAMTKQADKMFQLIRPRSGTLFAAERYLSELYQIMSYLRGITRVDEVGRYAQSKRNSGESRSVHSNSLPSTRSAKVVKIKHYFKDIFERELYDDAAVEYFSDFNRSMSGLVKISQEDYLSAERLRANLAGQNGPRTHGVLVPRYVKVSGSSKLSNNILKIDERAMYDLMFARQTSGHRQVDFNADQKGSHFSIIENQSLLKDSRSSQSARQLVTLKKVFGESNIEDQLSALQDSGYLKEKNASMPGANSAMNRALHRSATGEELTEILGQFLEANAAQVEYFNGISTIGRSFDLTWATLTEQKYKSLIRSNRPILCRLVGIRTTNFLGEGNMSSTMYETPSFNQVFLITAATTRDHAPARSREGNVLSSDSSKSRYESEFLSSDSKTYDPESLKSGGWR